MLRPPPTSTLFPYTTLFRSGERRHLCTRARPGGSVRRDHLRPADAAPLRADRKSTRLNSSHVAISYAVFCLKKKNDFAWFARLHTAASYALAMHLEAMHPSL